MSDSKGTFEFSQKYVHKVLALLSGDSWIFWQNCYFAFVGAPLEISTEDEEEKLRLISQVLELQNTLDGADSIDADIFSILTIKEFSSFSEL